ncbi:uncharacterized protein VNE69_03375 [Vairimorpha necatrix]|uniref:Uncharacterized protein n=1 Tax=Vairimorpha necatrix TaxID=6039 RepID=A0AAX4JBC3_9MICR
MNLIFKVSRNIHFDEIGKLEKEFQLNVILFLFSYKPDFNKAEISKFIQSLAYNSYKLIYYLSQTYTIKNNIDKAILKLSIKNNIELKVSTKCKEKIIQLFKNKSFYEIISNKKSYYEIYATNDDSNININNPPTSEFNDKNIKSNARTYCNELTCVYIPN